MNINAFCAILDAVGDSGNYTVIIMKLFKNRLAILFGIISIPCNIYAAELGGEYTSLICPQSLDIPERPFVNIDLADGDTHISADNADLVEGGISVLQGNAEIKRDSQQIKADTIKYDQPNDSAKLDGNVNYWDEGLFLKSKKANLKLENGSGEFEDANYILVDSRGKGTAEKLFVDVGTLTELEEVNYTTCSEEEKFWHLTADKISLNHEKNWGTARNVLVKIKNIPVFYSPYMSFPLSKERKSGFLAPGYGATNRMGVELRTPYYWNISPSMDATITPRFLSDTGVMAMGEYRYLFPRSAGMVNFEYLPSDSSREDNHRNLFHITHHQSFADNGNLFFTYNRVSDKFYFEDFGNQLAKTSTRFLERRLDVSYNGNNWNLTGRLHDYQTVDSSIAVASRPYKRLPQILFNYASPKKYRQLNYGIKTNAVYFERGDDVSFSDNVNGARVSLRPYIKYPVHTTATYVEPKFGLDYTQYNLDNTTLFSENPNRVLPIFSVNSGIFLERETNIFGKNITQTLEPRLFYLYIPNENQSDLPVFDTGLFDFSFDSLFRENRFSGQDRLGDANQITLAVTSHLINQRNGKNYGNVRIGQIFYFRDRKTTLPNGAIRDEASSPIVAEINTALIENWVIGGDIQWDPNIGDGTEKITARAVYNPTPGKILNLAYRVRRDTTDIEQSDISFRWPFNRKWSAVGRWNYAVPEGRSLELFGGIEYESCCWSLRAVGRRFLTNINGVFDTGIFLQLELKGLAGVGKKTVNFLREQIPGYQSGF